MSAIVPSPLAESLAHRLLVCSRRLGEDHQFVLIRFGLERLMYRLRQSRYAEAFILKGAMMFLVWGGSTYRSTKDLDLLGVQPASVERMAEIFRDICQGKVMDDGLSTVPATVAAEAIREDAACQGVQLKLTSRLGQIKIPLQVDVGFGDATIPKPQAAGFATLFDFPAPWLIMYARESTMAEKFEAMVRLDGANSRMKDFHDIWALCQTFAFEAANLAAPNGNPGGSASGIDHATCRPGNEDAPMAGICAARAFSTGGAGLGGGGRGGARFFNAGGHYHYNRQASNRKLAERRAVAVNRLVKPLLGCRVLRVVYLASFRR